MIAALSQLHQHSEATRFDRSCRHARVEAALRGQQDRQAAFVSSFCGSVIPTYTTISVLLGKFFATSRFKRRSMKGSKCDAVSIRCPTARYQSIFVFHVVVAANSHPNHALKNAALSKMSGRRNGRLRARMLFWSGVPVRSRRCSDRSDLSSCMSLQSLFFSRCPSSIVMCHH